MKLIITLCGENAVLLVLMKTVHIITTVLQTVEKPREEKLGKNFPVAGAHREANGTFKTTT
jgi:hypothetical protein